MGEIQSYLIRQVMEHPDVRSLAPGTELIAALGIADSSSIRSSLEASLQRHMLGPQSSRGIGKGVTPPTKGATGTSRLPTVVLGMTQDGKNALVNENFGSYTSHNRKKGKSSEIPWLNWMLNRQSGRVFGYSARLGDFPKSRTGEAIMKSGGSFSINSWLKGTSDFLAETLGRGSVQDKVLEIFKRHLSNAMAEAISRANKETSGRAQRIQAASRVSARLDISDVAVAAEGTFEEALSLVDRYVQEVVKQTGISPTKAFIAHMETLAGEQGITAVITGLAGDAKTRGLSAG